MCDLLAKGIARDNRSAPAEMRLSKKLSRIPCSSAASPALMVQVVEVVRARGFAGLGLLLAAVELAQVAVDATPLLYFGDSATFVASSSVFTVPLYRSWVYPLLIRVLAVWPNSLTGLVIGQALAGAATCWLLAYMLVKLLGVSRKVAWIGAFAFAFEPLQVVQERLVLPESFAGLVLALFCLAACSYVRRPVALPLVGVCIAGMFAVSFRSVCVPVTLAAAILLPALVLWSVRVSDQRWIGAHVASAIVATLALHVGYGALTGALARKPAAYLYGDGFFIAGAWWPLLTPHDAGDDASRRIVADLQAHPPSLPLYIGEKVFHLWWPGGLRSRLMEAFGEDVVAANAAARTLALNALRRDPRGVARIAWETFVDYETRSAARTRVSVLGRPGKLRVGRPSGVFDGAKCLWRRLFNRSGHDDAGQAVAPSRRALVLAFNVVPLVCAAAAMVRRATAPFLVALAATSAILLVTTYALSVEPAVRYLHPVAFPLFVGCAVLIDAARTHRGPTGARVGIVSPFKKLFESLCQHTPWLAPSSRAVERVLSVGQCIRPR